MVEKAVAKYGQLRRGLLAKVDVAFAERLRFEPQQVVVRSVSELWDSLGLLQLVQQKVRAVAEDLRPVLARLLGARRPQALFEQKDQTAVWRWAEAAEAKAAVDVPKVLEAVASLLEFVALHCASTAEVSRAFGFSLYPQVARQLRKLDLCAAETAVEQFEKRLQLQGLIGEGESSLSRHVRAQIQAQEQRLPRVLAEARTWLLEVSDELVPVEEAELPPMKVSPTALKLARQIGALAKEPDEEAPLIISQLCTLFGILRPYAQGELKSDPLRCAVFVADVMFLIHSLSQVPGSLRPSQALKRKGEEQLGQMLQYQQERASKPRWAAPR
ncbi:unnamed protein product [Effrenium voratum]|nr:unnamed protein product [Effrenium voratum]